MFQLYGLVLYMPLQCVSRTAYVSVVWFSALYAIAMGQ